MGEKGIYGCQNTEGRRQPVGSQHLNACLVVSKGTDLELKLIFTDHSEYSRTFSTKHALLCKWQHTVITGLAL